MSQPLKQHDQQKQFWAIYSAALSGLRNLSVLKHISQDKLRQVALDATIVTSGLRTGYLFDAFAIRDKQTTLRQVLEDYLGSLRKTSLERFKDVVLIHESCSEQLFFVNMQKLRQRTWNTQDRSDSKSPDVVYVRLDGSQAQVSPPPARLDALLGDVVSMFADDPSHTQISLREVSGELDIGTMVAFAAFVLDFPVAYVPISGSNTAYLAEIALDVYECVLEANPETVDIPQRHVMIKFSCPQSIGQVIEGLLPSEIVNRLRAQFEERLRVEGFPGKLAVSHGVEKVDRVAI